MKKPRAPQHEADARRVHRRAHDFEPVYAEKDSEDLIGWTFCVGGLFMEYGYVANSGVVSRDLRPTREETEKTLQTLMRAEESKKSNPSEGPS